VQRAVPTHASSRVVTNCGHRAIRRTFMKLEVCSRMAVCMSGKRWILLLRWSFSGSCYPFQHLWRCAPASEQLWHPKASRISIPGTIDSCRLIERFPLVKDVDCSRGQDVQKGQSAIIVVM